MKNDTSTCKSCPEYFVGECIGKTVICEFYAFKPPMTRRKYEEWPGYYVVNPYR